MKKVTIKDLYRNTENYIDKTVEVAGWVRTVRDSKAFGFIELNDGSFFNNLQIVFNDKLANFEEVRKLTISSSIIVNGTVVKTENAKQPFEIHADSVEIFNLADADYPLQKKRHTLEYLRTIAHLRPRSNTFSAVFTSNSTDIACCSDAYAQYSIVTLFSVSPIFCNCPIGVYSDALFWPGYHNDDVKKNRYPTRIPAAAIK